MQRQQLDGIVSRSAADLDSSYEVIEPNSGVLLPVELDYAIAELDSPRQRCGANQKAKAICPAQSIVGAAECFRLAISLEAARLTPRSRLVDSILGQTMPKLSVERFDRLRPRRYGWHRCWVSGLLHWWGGSSCCRIMSGVGRALKYPYSFECQVSQVPHMLVAIGCVRCNVSCRGHDCHLLGLGHQFSLVELYL
jgi:hypothetical protein